MRLNRRIAGARSVLSLCLLLAVTACGDQGIANPSGDVSATLASPLSEAAAEQLALSLALALADDAFRSEVFNDMKRSPIREKKLHLRTYVNEHDGRVGSKLANRLGLTYNHFLTDVLDRVPDLEFYMPVRDHRRRWDGHGDILVAYQLNENEPPIGFDLAGRRHVLLLRTPPTQPTLVVVPSETDFARVVTEVYPRGGESISVQDDPECSPQAPLDPCDDSGSGGNPTPSGGSPAGLYLNYVYLSDLHEPWISGDPEIEAMMLTRGQSSALTLRTCANQSNASWRHYNQDSNHWYGLVGGSGTDRLVADSAEIIQALNPPAMPASLPDSLRGLVIQFWEDDADRCSIVIDASTSSNLNDTIEGLKLLGLSAGFAVLTWGAYWEVAVFAGAVGLISIVTGGFTFSSDDFIGQLVPAAEWNSQTGSSITETHAIVKKVGSQSTLVGRANVYGHPTNYYQ